MTGDAALHAEAANVSDIAQKIRLLLSDEVLRRRLVDAGRKRAGEFSWDRCARETLEVYRAALG